MKPVWLLDVDGVINAIARKGDKSVWPEENWRSASISAVLDFDTNWFFPILWSTDVIEFICSMAKKVDIRWHTTWQEAASANLAPALGLPEFPVAEAPEYKDRKYGTDWWKLGAAERVVFDEGRPLIWTDDELFFWLSNARRLELAYKSNSLFIAPHQNIGLSLNNIKTIREFVDASD